MQKVSVTVHTERGQSHARTDDHGRFAVDHLDPDQKLRSIGLWHALYLAAKHELPPDARGDLGVFRIHRGMTLQGRVLDPSGRPVQGAMVHLRHAEDRLDRIADDRGRFHFSGIPKGEFKLRASAPGHGWCGLQIMAHAGRGELPSVDLQLTEDHKIHGTIRDRRGNPIRGVRVSAYPPTDILGIGMSRTATSNQRGEYTITGLPLQKLLIHAHGDEAWRDRMQEGRANSTHVDFVLDPVLALRLRLLDAQTRQPIPLVKITAWIPKNQLSHSPMWWAFDFARSESLGWSRTLTTKKGVVHLRISELLKAQELNLQISASGYKNAELASLRAAPRPKLQTILLDKLSGPSRGHK